MSDNPFHGDFDDEPSLEAAEPVQATTMTSNLSRLEQLRAREQELLKRQRELSEQREEIIKSPNFPAFYPVVYFNMEEDIPHSAKDAVKYALWGLIAITIAAIFNVIAVLCVSGLPSYPKVRCFIFAIIQGLALVYCALHYSYQKLYDACKRHDIPFSFTLYQLLITVACVYLTIGFPTSGSVGLATFLDLIAKSNSFASMAIALANTALIACATLCEMLVLMRSQAYQKVSGLDAQNSSHVSTDA